MTRQFSPAVYNGVKSAWKLLVQGIGGVDAVAACTRASRSLASDYGNIASDRFAPADIILDAEAIAGTPHVTEALARAHGCVLIPVAARGGSALAAELAEIGRDVGMLFADAAAALTHAQPTPAERATLVRDLDRLARVVIQARCLLHPTEEP